MRTATTGMPMPDPGFHWKVLKESVSRFLDKDALTHSAALAYFMVFSLPPILLVSLALDAFLSLLGSALEAWNPLVGMVVNFLDQTFLDLVVISALFATMFRCLPDVRLKWRETWFAAVLTAILFMLGQFLIGYIIGQSDASDYYDAAGSVLVLMLWVY